MFRIAVCDDEESVRQKIDAYLKKYQSDTKEEFEVLFYSSGNELIFDFPKDLDLLLLDIYMDSSDGMEIAHEIREFDQELCIVFITTMVHRALEGYGVRAFGFISKPVAYPEFKHELTSALNDIRKRKTEYPVLRIPVGRGMILVPTHELYYCEVQYHALSLFYKDHTEEARLTIGEMEEKLAPYGFLRCHASYLVNARLIRRIDADQLLMTSGKKIPISQRRKKEFMSRIFNLYSN